MYGLAAIQQANGFAMAGAGAGIVICGLAVLSFLISLLPRVTAFFESKPKAGMSSPPETDKTPPHPIVPETLPDDIEAAAALYMSFSEGLGSEFSLVDLHRTARELQLPHPHLSISRFRDAGLLISTGAGRFSWKSVTE
jgi:hypothetical protein